MAPSRAPSFYALGFLALINLVSANSCYWANSTRAPDDRFSIAPDDTACFPNQENSPCCATGWTCLSNGICSINQGSGDIYYRGTCTDNTWKSPQCPGWCFRFNSDTSVPMRKCDKASGEDWYCCDGDPNCDCDTGFNVVDLGTTQATTVTVIRSTSWPGFTPTSSAFSTGGFANVNANPTGSTTPGTGAGAQSTTGSSASSSSSSSNNTALAAGLGAGLGVGLTAILAIAAFIILRRRHRAKKSSPNSHYPDQVPPYTNIPGSSNGSNGNNSHFVPGQGYYATTAINEKAGGNVYEKSGVESDQHRRQYALQELSGTSESEGSHIYGNGNLNVGRSPSHTEYDRSDATMSTQGRIELA